MICWLLLTRADDDGGGLVVNGHGAVVGGDWQPAAHLVKPPVHHGPVTPVTGVAGVLAVLTTVAVVGINFDAFLDTFKRQSMHFKVPQLFLVVQVFIKIILMVNNQLITFQVNSLRLHN